MEDATYTIQDASSGVTLAQVGGWFQVQLISVFIIYCYASRWPYARLRGTSTSVAVSGTWSADAGTAGRVELHQFSFLDSFLLFQGAKISRGWVLVSIVVRPVPRSTCQIWCSQYFVLNIFFFFVNVKPKSDFPAELWLYITTFRHFN